MHPTPKLFQKNIAKEDWDKVLFNIETAIKVNQSQGSHNSGFIRELNTEIKWPDQEHIIYGTGIYEYKGVDFRFEYYVGGVGLYRFAFEKSISQLVYLEVEKEFEPKKKNLFIKVWEFFRGK